MEHYLRDSPATLELRYYDRDGALANVGAVTATVTDAAGVAITGSPFATDNPSTGVYQASTGLLTAMGVYDVTWNLPVSVKRRAQFEVVGAYLFELADLRAADPSLADVVKYPARLLRARRDEITERFEEVAEVSFVPRAHREVLDGDATSTMLLGRVMVDSVLSASIDDVALTVGQLADVKVFPHGLIARSEGAWGAGRRNVVVTYVHGFEIPPSAVSNAAVQVAVASLLKGPLDANARATAVITDIGGYRLTVAGRDGHFGLPEVDSVLAAFRRHRKVGFA